MQHLRFWVMLSIFWVASFAASAQVAPTTTPTNSAPALSPCDPAPKAPTQCTPYNPLGTAPTPPPVDINSLHPDYKSLEMPPSGPIMRAALPPPSNCADSGGVPVKKIKDAASCAKDAAELEACLMGKETGAKCVVNILSSDCLAYVPGLSDAQKEAVKDIASCAKDLSELPENLPAAAEGVGGAWETGGVSLIPAAPAIKGTVNTVIDCSKATYEAPELIPKKYRRDLPEFDGKRSAPKQPDAPTQHQGAAPPPSDTSNSQVVTVTPIDRCPSSQDDEADSNNSQTFANGQTDYKLPVDTTSNIAEDARRQSATTPSDPNQTSPLPAPTALNTGAPKPYTPSTRPLGGACSITNTC